MTNTENTVQTQNTENTVQTEYCFKVENKNNKTQVLNNLLGLMNLSQNEINFFNSLQEMVYEISNTHPLGFSELVDNNISLSINLVFDNNSGQYLLQNLEQEKNKIKRFLLETLFFNFLDKKIESSDTKDKFYYSMFFGPKNYASEFEELLFCDCDCIKNDINNYFQNIYETIFETIKDYCL